jgi:hypothetical protein
MRTFKKKDEETPHLDTGSIIAELEAEPPIHPPRTH